MKRRDFLRTTAAAAGAMVAPHTIFADPAPPRRPNFVFIMADDHAAHALSCYGSRINKTPQLDRIAREGMLFENCFCTNGICAPSRAVILTGKHSHLNGVINNGVHFDGSQQTFPKILQQAGYDTAMIGKWHLKTDPTGFDYWNVLPGQGAYYNPVFKEMGAQTQYTGYVTDLITDFSMNWLRNRTDSDKPFLLMCHHKAPHRNWMPDANHSNMYDGETIPEPDTLFDDYETRCAAAREQTMSIDKNLSMTNDLKMPSPAPPDAEKPNRFWESGPFRGLNERQREIWTDAYAPQNERFRQENPLGDDLVRWKYQRYIKDYLRCIASVDDNVGRLLDYLEASGQAENTVIVYTSDQGFYLGDHGWFDKRFIYEESLRMPLMVRWPAGVKPGARSEALVSNLDFAETFLDLAGVTPPADMQGESFKPILTDGRTPDNWRDAVYYHYYEYPGVHTVKRHYGLRTDRYKLAHFYYDIDAWEMYDLEKDPDELHNVHDDPAYSDVQRDLKARLEQLREQYGDSEELAHSYLPKPKEEG